MKGSAFITFFKTRKGIALLIAAAAGALGLSLTPEQLALLSELAASALPQ